MIIIAFIVFYLFATPTQDSLRLAKDAKEWNKIIPLHSVRADVERLLKVKSIGGPFEVFDVEDGKIMIYYAEHPCSNSDEKWKVPIGTVLGMCFVPKDGQTVRSLGIDISSLKDTSYMSTDTYVTRYENEDDGFAVEIIHGKVSSLIYLPSAKDRNLLCIPPPRKQ